MMPMTLTRPAVLLKKKKEPTTRRAQQTRDKSYLWEEENEREGRRDPQRYCADQWTDGEFGQPTPFFRLVLNNFTSHFKKELLVGY